MSEGAGEFSTRFGLVLVVCWGPAALPARKLMQKRALTALIVLAVLAFGLLAGAHPCSAGQERGEAPAAPSSCHSGMGMKTDGPQDASPQAGVPSHEHGSSKGCGTFCQHACHMTAVAETRAVAFAIAPLAQAVVEAPGFGLSRFAHPIDHIPLA
jgi:hypothetical protein